MSKSMVKIIAVLLMAIMTITALSQIVLAATAEDTVVNTESAMNVDQFKGKTDSSGASESAQNVIGALITIVRVIGTGVAIIMLVVLAIKYISAAPSDKAEIKKHAVVYVVGAVVLFAASGILGIIQQFAGNIKSTSMS